MKLWTEGAAMARFPKSIWLAAVFIVCANYAWGVDYVRLRSGQTAEGAILRQDTSVVIMTDWESRGLPMPPLTVYARNEVESIWLDRLPAESEPHLAYSPHAGSVEIGGSLLFQTWAGSEFERRHVFQFSVQGGYAITKAFGFDASADFTVPLGGSADSVWNSYDPAYQFSMSVVAQPLRWKTFIPYALAGGGASVGIPTNGIILTSANDVRSMVNAGIGIKWGIDHLGVRAEARHHYYAWTPDRVDENGIRVAEQTADATMFRVGLFYFR